jgi:hypothetical protein
MKIGVVISDSEMDLGENFECITYNDTYEYDELPKLYVGMDKVADIFNIKIDVFNRVIMGNEFWTFTKKEHRNHHAGDIIDFVEFCYKRLISDVEYQFIDPLLLSDAEHTNLFNSIKFDGHIITYVNKDMVYMCQDKKIWGLNLMFYQFQGIDRLKLLDRIKAISDVLLEGDDILIEYKDFMEAYGDDLRYIPYLYSIKNNVN